VLKQATLAALQQVEGENRFPTRCDASSLSVTAAVPIPAAVLIERQDVSAIFNVKLCVHHDVQINVQCARGLRRFRDLDGHALAGVFDAPPLPCSLSSSVVRRSSHRANLEVKDSPRNVLARAMSFATIARRKVLFRRIPLLIGG